jgi:hypothetical protein
MQDVLPGSPDQGRYDNNLLAEAKKVGVKHIVKLSGKISDHHAVGFSSGMARLSRRSRRATRRVFQLSPFGNASCSSLLRTRLRWKRPTRVERHSYTSALR